MPRGAVLRTGIVGTPLTGDLDETADTDDVGEVDIATPSFDSDDAIIPSGRPP